MLNIRTEIRDEATPLLRRLHAQLAPGKRRPLMAFAGKALERALREHFADRDNDTTTARARKGWPKQHFWARRIRDNTVLAEVTPDTATVRIASREFRQKYYGGTIRPGPGKRALAIPLTRDTYGKRASSNPVEGGLFVWKSPKTGKAFLAGNTPAADGSLQLYYRLIRSVRQQPDPRALPPQATTARTIDTALQRWANRRLK